MKFKITPVTHYQQNCSLIICEDTNKAAIVDPGGDVEKLIAMIAAEKVELEKVLLTHGHFDHVGGAVQIAEHFDIPIIGPAQEDEFWLDRLPGDARMFGFSPTKAFTPDQWLADDDQVNIGNLQLLVIHCPGHTPGHVVFVEKQQRLAFVGDVLFKDSIGRTDFPLGDYQTLIHSIIQKLLPLGDEFTFVPGHGPISTFGRERLHNPFITGES